MEHAHGRKEKKGQEFAFQYAERLFANDAGMRNTLNNLYFRFMTLNALMKEVKAKNRKLSFFCGAGISRNSGIPMVNDTYEYLSTLLTDTAGDAKILFDLLNVSVTDKKSELPFESIMQELIADTGSSNFLSLYRLGHPNANHFLITLLAKQKKVNWIITTNFDLLFEEAFKMIGFVNGIDFKVYYDEKGFDEAIHTPDDHTKLIKIHGSISSEKSIRVTIESIAQENLLTKRKNMVEHIFTSQANDYLIFLGYSFSDKFDITPHIAQIDKQIHPHIVVIEHGEGTVIFDEIKCIRAFKEKEVSGYKVKVKTEKFMVLLARHLLSATTKNEPAKLADPFKDEKVDWQSCLGRWLNQAANSNAKYLACSKLAQELGNVQLQEKYAALAAKQLPNMPRDKWYYLVAIQVIFSDSRLIDSNSTRIDIIARYEQLKQDLESNQEIDYENKQRLLSTIIYQIAREIENTGADVWTAVKLYKLSFRLDQSIGDKKGMAKALHQMAFVLIRS